MPVHTHTPDPTQSLGKANSLPATFSLACSSANWPGYLHKHDNDKHMLVRKIMLMTVNSCWFFKRHLPDMSFTFLTPSADKTASTISGLSLKTKRFAVDNQELYYNDENLNAAQCMGAQPQWREFPRLTSAPFSSRSLIIERCCSITWDDHDGYSESNDDNQ